MEYYYFPPSYWSRIVSLVLAEKGQQTNRHLVDIRRNASFDPDYLRINPRGVVPTLVHAGKPLWDGPSIVSYLDELGGSPLREGESPELIERLEALPIMLFSYSVWVLGKRGEKSKDILEDKIARAARYAEDYPDLSEEYLRKGEFFRVFREELYDEAHVAREEDKARELLTDLAELVTKSTYIGGERFSYADCIAIPAIYRLADVKKADIWRGNREHPLVRYYDRVRARPSYAAVFVDDPLIPEESKGDGRLFGFRD
jgi:glutathione S-transferase